MTGSLLTLLVAVPLVAAGVLTMLGHHRRTHTVIMFAVLLGSTLSGILLILTLSGGETIAHGVGTWPVGIAIPFVADMFAALMLTITGVITVTCIVFALASGRASSGYFAPLLLAMIAGVNGAILTADLFNLFVFIEVMLLGSYGLYVLAGNTAAPLRQIAGARLYITLNLLTSTVFLAGVGFIYGTAGTVNLAELAGTAQHDPTIALATSICLFALGIKASVVPVNGWLARTYPATSPAITALFSGLHTKVAIYAIYRIYAVVFDGDTRWLWLGVLIFSVTMVIGVLGAVGETTTRSILAFHMVSQIGYILLGVAIFTQAGLAAGIFYLVHNMIVKTALFLSTGAIEHRYGTGTIGALSNIARVEPVVATAFFIAALSMAGLPPFSGFVAKLCLVMAALEVGQIAAVVVMILVSLITLLSMLKIWSGVFWGTPPPTPPDKPDQPMTPSAAASCAETAAVATQQRPETDTTTQVGFWLAAPCVVLAGLSLALGVGAEILMDLADTAASGLLDTGGYVEAVTGS